MRDFWLNAGSRCLDAHAPTENHSELLWTLAGDICKELMPRDDYPELGILVNGAVLQGDINPAFDLIDRLFPGWGHNVGRPLTARAPCGWYACVFREQRSGDSFGPLAGMWVQDGRRGGNGQSKYANGAALALMAALCYALADNEIGASALDPEYPAKAVGI